MKKRKDRRKSVLKRQALKKVTSVVVSASMLVSTLSVATGKAAEAEEKEKGIFYAFSSDSFHAAEYDSKDSEMKITLTRSGEISKPSEMVLISYDVSAEYGKDYTLSDNGKELQKKDSVTSMFKAFKDNSFVGDYEEDNKAFVDGLLNQSGFSMEGENNIVPMKEETSKDKDKTKADSLKDADADGINLYNSLSTLDNIGADSTRLALSFAPGEKTKEVTLSVKPDALVEYNECFFLSVVSTEVDKYLKKHKEGIPDIPLRKGRDIAVTSVTIEDSSKEEPGCTVYADQEKHIIQDGKDTATVSFSREGACDNFSTVLLKKEGKDYGYFYYSPYQKVQEAELEAGNYEIISKGNCTISGSKTIIVEPESKAGNKSSKNQKKAGLNSSNDLKTIYAYDALLVDNNGKEKRRKKAGTLANGNPDWFPEWAVEREENDYIGHMQQGSSLFSQDKSSEYCKGYSNTEYISDKKKEFHSKSVYNTFRMNTSGAFSSTKDSVVRAKSDYYDLTGIDSVEACYYVDDTDLNIKLGVSDATKKEEFVETKGTHNIEVTLPATGDYSSQYIYFQNDNGDKYDGADVYLANALKFNKRKYQIQITNSNKLDFISKSGEQNQSKAANVVAADQYDYLKMGKDEISLNMNIDDSYPMSLVGYQLMEEGGEKPYAGTRKDLEGSTIPFTKEFVKSNCNNCFLGKRTDLDKGYTTFVIQPIMEKIKLDEFSIINVSEKTKKQTYKGRLICETDEKELCQGDYAILSAEDVQEGYTFSGVFVKRWRAESSDPTTCIYSVEADKKVNLKLEKGYTKYEVEPVFSGHEADTVTVSYADGAKEHGTLTNNKNSQKKDDSDMDVPSGTEEEEDGSDKDASSGTVGKEEDSDKDASSGTEEEEEDSDKDVSCITVVRPEEYRKNSYIPLVAKPNEGYLTCWYSGARTYYGDTFYYQLDGSSEHNDIKVDFVKKGDGTADTIKTTTVDLELALYEREVNLRNSSAYADKIPLSDMQVVTTTSANEAYKATTNEAGKVKLEKFEGVIGERYSMMIYRTDEKRYRYVEYIYTGKKSCEIEVPAFAGMSAYPENVSVDINGTSGEQLYIDLTNTGEVKIVVTVYRPDADTKLGKVKLAFSYKGKDNNGEQVMSKKEYTIEKPDSSNENGVYHTYSMKVSPTEIPNSSVLYVDVNSSYKVIQTGSDGKQSESMTIESSTGYVNTGYSFKQPNESSEIAVLKDVPELPGIESAGGDVSIPFIGSLDFGFTAKNGVYFVRQDDPNNPDVWYFLAGYNAVSTWTKTITDKYKGAKATREALLKAEEASNSVGDINGGSSDIVKLNGASVINVAPTVSMKLVMKDMEKVGSALIGYDMVIGLDELISYTLPLSIYGIPCYLNITFNGEQFLEVHASGDDFAGKDIKYAVKNPVKDAEMSYYIQIPNLDISLKAGVGYNAFAGIYVTVGGNLKANLEYKDEWKCGGYFYLTGGIGLDCAVFGGKIDVNIPKEENRAFGDENARKNIHSATARTSKGAYASGNGVIDVVESMNKTLAAADENTVFKITRNQSENTKEDSTKLNTVLKPAGRNVKVQLVKLSDKKVMAMTLADNKAVADSLNYLSGVYSISNDGGKTWNSKKDISRSSLLQWNVNYYKLNNKVLLTWSEGDLDAATGEKLNARSKFKPGEVAKALKSFDLKGRYFDMDGNPVGESFTIVKDASAAINSLDASENQDGTVDLYYERRAYNENAATITELMTQEQTICLAVLDNKGRTGTEDKRVLVQSEDGNKNYRITELKAFDYKGIKGQVIVLDGDGKLVCETEDGVEASMEDRQIYVRIVSDANGNIPAGTLMPLTEAGACAQNISLLENGEHNYLFWNQNGSIKSAVDFLPTTAEQYKEWCKHAGNLGYYTLISDTDSLEKDTSFRVAMNEKGKGIILWKNTEGAQFSDDKIASQINAGMFTTDKNGNISSSAGPVTLNEFLSEINSPDIQVLEDGTVVLCCTQLDGKTMNESSNSDAVADTVEENIDVKITQAGGFDYPLPGEEYTSHIALWNSGMGNADNLVISASGALNGSASLKELVSENELNGKGVLGAGQTIKVGLPVKAKDSFKDGEEVIYTVSRNGKTLATFKDTVRKGAYMVPQKMAEVVSIPGTDHYQVSLTVTNQGNQSGTTDIQAYTYDQGVQNKESDASRISRYKDKTVINPGGTAVISYILKNAAHKDDGLHMIGFMTGDGYNQAVEGSLPDRMESLKGSGNTKQPGNTSITLPKKGDILTLGTKTTRAKYKVTSSNTVTYYRVKVSSGITSAKVPDTVKISGKIYKVTAVASDAFKGNRKLKKITLGKNVNAIPAKAFYKQKKLTTLVILSTKLNKIGSSAFAGCDNLKTFTLKSKKITKKSVKNSLKGSKIKYIKTTSALKKMYKKYFTKKNAGRKVSIK